MPRVRRAAMALAVLMAACSPARTAAPVPGSRLKVVDIQVGRAVGADKRVSARSDEFAPGDTVYTSVVTEGAVSRATLAARWMYQGAMLEETAQRIAPDATTVSEFHVFNPTGWAPGQYRVEILLDGHVVGERTFRVEVPSNAAAASTKSLDRSGS